MDRQRFQGRIHKLAEAMQAAGIDAFMATSAEAMGYLAGFSEDGHERFLSLMISRTGDQRLICPALSAAQAERLGIANILPWKDGEDPYALFESVADAWDLRGSVIAVDDAMRADALIPAQQRLPAALFQTGGKVLAELRRRKTAEELSLMRKAARIADDCVPVAMAAIRPGVREIEVRQMLEAAMKERGGSPSFCIVATGAASAEPHHLADDTVIQAGDVVICDFGCSVEGYQSDITRTFACGKASEEAHLVYRTVLEAHNAGRTAARTGVACQEVDRAARRVIQDAGYGDRFIHRTGHGIGLSVHEEPNMIEGNTQVLEEGNCFSVEPGIYLTGRFGVRIENIIAIEGGVGVSLNDEPQTALVELG